MSGFDCSDLDLGLLPAGGVVETLDAAGIDCRLEHGAPAEDAVGE